MQNSNLTTFPFISFPKGKQPPPPPAPSNDPEHQNFVKNEKNSRRYFKVRQTEFFVILDHLNDN